MSETQDLETFLANLDWANRTFREGAHHLLSARASGDLEDEMAREVLGRIYRKDPDWDDLRRGAAAFWARPGVQAFFSQGGLEISRSLPVWRLRELAVPTLLVWGERDRFFPVDEVRMGVMYIPNSRLLVVEDGTHSPFVDAPDMFYLAVDGFLSDEE